MKKNISPNTDDVIDFLKLVEKQAKQGKIPRALPKDASFEERMKYSLCKLFVRFLIKNRIKAIELAKLLKIPKTRISDIMNYKTEKYTVDRLLGYAWKLAQEDAPTREHLHLMFEILSGPVRSVKESKKIEKELLRHA
jgi:predicted XRE-type DNA-binding protein